MRRTPSEAIFHGSRRKGRAAPKKKRWKEQALSTAFVSISVLHALLFKDFIHRFRRLIREIQKCQHNVQQERIHFGVLGDDLHKLFSVAQILVIFSFCGHVLFLLLPS